MFEPFAQGPYTGMGSPSGGANFPSALPFNEASDYVEASSDSAPFLGLDGQQCPVSIDFTTESPHVLVSAGTGGGKSTVARSISAQWMAKGGLTVQLDIKRHSHRWAKGLEPLAHYASSVPEIGNALIEVGKEVHRRNEIVERHHGPIETAPVGPPILVVFEEMNATASHLKSLDRQLPKGMYKAEDAKRDIVCMGRAARVHMLGLAQLASFRAVGGSELVENFDQRIMLRYSAQAWRWLGEGPYVSAPPQPGRGVIAGGGRAREVQFMSMAEEDARALVLSSERAQNRVMELTPLFRRLPRPWREAMRQLDS